MRERDQPYPGEGILSGCFDLNLIGEAVALFQEFIRAP
jgi:hypothetical protein